MPEPSAIPVTPLLLMLTLAAAITDARWGLIPNALTLPALLLAPPVHGLLSGPGALGGAVAGVLLCGAVPLLLFVRGGMGGGDVKLYAAIGGLLGASPGLQLQLLSYVLASLWACGALAFRGQLWATLFAALRRMVPWRRGDAVAVPGLALAIRMGPAIFVAAALSRMVA